MSDAATELPPIDQAVERRTRILDAAERCFTRAGFHRTTMQDISAEAAMSPGNLYRYFASKDAIVAGLGERDRADMAADFIALEGAEDFAAAFRAIGCKHFQDEPRERSILCLEIWAEATRNPTFAAMSKEFDDEIVGRMTGLFRQAQERGAIATKSDPRELAILVVTLANGLFVRRAVAVNFDPQREVANVLSTIGALLNGAVDLSGAKTGLCESSS